MTELTIQELEDKIKRVETDIEQLQREGTASRKLEVLSEYKEYLEDEIQFLKNEARNSKT